MQRTDGTPLLTAQGLTMSYPGVKALGGVDFDLRSGEIHALCGENGAGKSTLIKILGGIIPHGAFGGKVTVQGTECRFNGPADALQSGIRVIHQELALCEDLTVAENVCLGEEPSRFGLLDRKRMRLEAAAQLERLGLMDINPDIRAGTLPVGLRQMVEIARALRHPSVSSKTSSGSKVLILDEPTSALSAREAERLEATLHRLRNEGYALLYISHRLDEVFRLADRITVLRNGESAGTLERNEFNPDRVISMMVGRTADELFPTRTVVTAGSDSIPITVPLLSVRNWILPSPQNPDKHVLENISFDLHAGEILGIVGLMGAGRTELAESLCGLFPLQGRGEIKVEGKAWQGATEPAEWTIAAVRDAAKAAGRDPKSVKICVAAPAYVGTDIAHMREQTRWFGGMVGNHVADIVERYGENSNVPKALTDYIKGRQGYDYNEHGRAGNSHTTFVPDEIVDRFCILGDANEHIRRLTELKDLGVDQFADAVRGCCIGLRSKQRKAATLPVDLVLPRREGNVPSGTRLPFPHTEASQPQPFKNTFGKVQFCVGEFPRGGAFLVQRDLDHHIGLLARRIDGAGLRAGEEQNDCPMGWSEGVFLNV